MPKVEFIIGENTKDKEYYIQSLRPLNIRHFNESHKEFYDYLKKPDTFKLIEYPLTYIYPEAGLTPSKQLEFGSFVDSLPKVYTPHLVITHSDNILLRVRKLISKGLTDFTHYKITYFNKEGRKTIPITSTGKLGPGLPMSFFGCDILEVLDM